MAELERKDVWSDDLLNAPLQYSKNLKEAIDASKRLVDTMKEGEKNIQMATTLSGVSRETKKLSEAEIELAKVQKQITTASARQTSEYDAQNKKLLALRMQQQNKNKETKEEIVLTGRVGNEYKKLTIQLERARAKYKDMAASGRASTKELKAQERVVSSLNNRVTTIDKTVGQFNRNVGNYGSALAGSFKSILSAFGIIGGLQFGANLIKDSIRLSGELKGVKAAFDRLPESVKVLDAMREATGRTVSELELMKRTVQAANFGISLQALPKLFEFATLRAQQTGQSVDYLVDSIVTGIGRKSHLILDNLGISATQLKEKLGGVSTQAATVGQVAEAVGQIAEESLGNMAGFSQNAATSVQQLSAEWDNLKTALGDAANGTGVIGTSIKILTDLITNLKDALKGVSSGPASLMEALGLSPGSSGSAKEELNATTVAFKALNDFALKYYNGDVKKAQEEFLNNQYKEILNLEIQKASLDDLRRVSGDDYKESYENLNLEIKVRRDIIAAIKAETVALKDQEEVVEISEEARKDQKKNQLDLDKFRLEQQIKLQEEILKSEKNGLEERLQASQNIEGLRGQIAEVERKKDLLKEIENQSERVLIEEQKQAKITDAHRKGIEERDKLNDDYLKKEEEELKKRVELAKKESEELIKAKELELQKEVQYIQKFVLEGALSREEGDRAILEVRKKISLEIIDFTIQQLEKELLIKGLSAEDEKKIYAEIAKYRLKLTDEMYAQLGEKEKTRIEELEEDLTTVKEIYDDLSHSIIGIFDGIADRRIQAIDREIEALEKQTAREIQLAGDNEDAKEEIQARGDAKREQLEAKRRRELQAQARKEKAASLVSAAINTALAVTKTLATLGIPAGIPAAILAGALGAVQIAAIASQPLPAFKDGGTTSTPLIVAGEEGRELYKTPSGKIGLTPDRASVMRMPIGTDIIPHAETMKMLAMGTINPNIQPDNELSHRLASLESVISKGNKSLIKAVIESAPGDLFSQGSLLMESKKRVDGSRKIIHKKNFGY